MKGLRYFADFVNLLNFHDLLDVRGQRENVELVIEDDAPYRVTRFSYFATRSGRICIENALNLVTLLLIRGQREDETFVETANHVLEVNTKMTFSKVE